jgi:hypothetical protein
MALSLPVNSRLILSCHVDVSHMLGVNVIHRYLNIHMLNSGSFNVNIVVSGCLKSNGDQVIRIIKVDYLFTNTF